MWIVEMARQVCVQVRARPVSASPSTEISGLKSGCQALWQALTISPVQKYYSRWPQNKDHFLLTYKSLLVEY